MNRKELQQLSEDRLLDAQVLLAAQRWAAAYYLSGYAVECGLKSCVLAYVERTGVIFRDPKYATRCWTHNIEDLVKPADLEALRGPAVSANSVLAANWPTIQDWTELSRYQQKTQVEAQKLYQAIADLPDGVMQWLRGHW